MFQKSKALEINDDQISFYGFPRIFLNSFPSLSTTQGIRKWIRVSTFPHLFQSSYLLQFKPMSKAIDDPMIISIPSDYMQEDAIRRAIASSSNDFCSRSEWKWMRNSDVYVFNSKSGGMYSWDVDGRFSCDYCCSNDCSI